MQQLAKLTVGQFLLININSVVEFDNTATNLGVVLDGQLSMSQQVTAVCRSCFYHLGLRQLKSVKSSLTREALHCLIQAFVHCRLEYCNSALAGVLKFIFRDFRTWLLVRCLECAELNTSP